MKPQIGQVRTSDGVRIAYWSLGEHRSPLVILPSYTGNHLELEWDNPKFQAFYERLSMNRQIIRFDPRGLGMSQRDIGPLTLESLETDFLAVINALNLPKVALLSSHTSCPAAIMFAAHLPHRVSRSILWMPSITPGANPIAEALIPLIDKDWDLFLRARYRLQMDEDDANFRTMLTAQSNSPSFFKETRRLWEIFDASVYLPSIDSPTLLMKRTRYENPSYMRENNDEAALLSGLSDISLVSVEGRSREIIDESIDEAVDVIEQFLEGEEYLPVFSAQGPEYLSDRELEILRFIVKGMISKEIAIKLGISPNTVQRHIANIYHKTGVHGRAGITAFALKHGVR